mmetsp:Transcript_64461/g.153863  ORF Transcript_64461/g.153863 Transcript_64461/m.153863 type:complete len:189 (-) Transcript_64461:85-651(-)
MERVLFATFLALAVAVRPEQGDSHVLASAASPAQAVQRTEGNQSDGGHHEFSTDSNETFIAVAASAGNSSTGVDFIPSLDMMKKIKEAIPCANDKCTDAKTFGLVAAPYNHGLGCKIEGCCTCAGSPIYTCATKSLLSNPDGFTQQAIEGLGYCRLHAMVFVAPPIVLAALIGGYCAFAKKRSSQTAE